MNYMELTNKQNETLKFIKKFYIENDYFPTIREICKGMGVTSPSTAHMHVTNLIRKGYLEKTNGYRTYKIVNLYKGNDLQEMSKQQLIDIIYQLQLKNNILMYERNGNE